MRWWGTGDRPRLAGRHDKARVPPGLGMVHAETGTDCTCGDVEVDAHAKQYMSGFAAARCAGRAARYRKTLAIELHQQGLTLKTGNRELHGVRHPFDVLGKDACIRQRVQASFETIAQRADRKSTRLNSSH